MIRPPANILSLMPALLAVLPSVCLAAAGDVSFHAPDKTIHLDPASLQSSIDVVLEIDGMASVPAIGWGMIVNIVPQVGATGSVQFQPATIINNEPNLMPASQSPFVDFDRDFGGKSYGRLASSATQLHAFSHYVAPTLGPAPTLDPNGNLMLPDGSGLVSLPIVLSTDASGDFLVTFDANPAVTGAVFATGLPEPNDIGIHPPGTHMAGILSVINPAGDYNRNGIVDAADYVLWRKTLGQTGPGLPADGNDNKEVESGDYSVWRAHFGNTSGSSSSVSAITTVPEPAAMVMLLTGLLASIGFRSGCVNPRGYCDMRHEPLTDGETPNHLWWHSFASFE